VRHGTRLAAAITAATLVGLLLAGLGVSHREKPMTTATRFAALPPAPSPALKVGRLKMLSGERYVSQWTVIRRPTAAHAAPSASSAVVARLGVSTPEGTPNLLAVLRARTGAGGALWVMVRLPVLPNGTVGWVSRHSLGSYQVLKTHLVVDRRRLQATLYQNGKSAFTAPVGVGTRAAPTPAGDFTIRSKLTRYASPFYGPVAFGTTARSAVLTDWPDGGFIGLHGTNQPGLIPGRISHGCIRLRNEDILRLSRLMPVGTPLTIR
jgi:L,D-transpeptidase catalytic domain